MFFRIKPKCGEHEEEGRTYGPGDVIKTKRNLRKIFVGKFDKVHDEDEKKDTGHKTPDIKTPAVAASKETESDKDKTSKSDPVSTSSKKKNSKKYGVNVTEDFPLAETNDLRVYEKAKVFSIIEMDEDNKKILLKKTKKKDVVNYIEEMMEDEVHDDEDEDEEDDD